MYSTIADSNKFRSQVLTVSSTLLANIGRIVSVIIVVALSVIIIK